ncbi:MAG: hypothetical protein ACK4UN_16720 [Limisphaerales bacterium]
MSTVAEIEAAIERLTPAEQAEVIQFAVALARKRPLTADELNRLAQQMVESTDPAEVEKLKSALMRGFYGEASNA